MIALAKKKRTPQEIIDLNLFNEISIAAYLSKIVYEDSVARLLRRDGYMAVKFCDVDGAQAVCCVKDNVAYVAFRGTQPDKRNDIVADLKFWKRDSKLGGSVHLGFQTEVLKIEDDIRALMKVYNIKFKVLANSVDEVDTNLINLRETWQEMRPTHPDAMTEHWDDEEQLEMFRKEEENYYMGESGC